MKKLIVPSAEMKKVAEEHKAYGEEVRLHEAESSTHGRVIWVRNGKQILIIR